VIDRLSVPRILLASLLLRLVFACGLGYGVDEAYAVTVARPLSLSYFDHAPLHFWLAAFMTWSTGTTDPMVVRLPFLLAFTGTTWAIARLTRHWFGETAARIAALSLSASGVLGVTSASWVLPDGPLLLCSALGVLLLAPVLTDASPRADGWWRWLLGGSALGLAVLSKYHAALFIAAIGCLVLADRDLRRQLRTPWPWGGFALALAGLVPVLWWNATHQWASFAFQGGRARAAHWSLAPFAESVGGQLLWLLPWIGVPLVLATWRALPRARADRRVRLLLALAAGPVVVFTAITLGGARGLPHWQAPGWLFAFPLLGLWGAHRLEQRATVGRWLVASPALTAALVLLIVGHARGRLLDPWLSMPARATDPTRDAVSWRAAVDTSQVLLVRSWIQGGQLGVAAGATPRAIICLCADPHHFAFRYDTLPRWRTGVLVERVQPWRRQWLAAPAALAGDSLDIVLRDTLRVDGAVLLARYDVTRRPRSTAAASAAW
jgi:4-amino-4-deoxy-L-arabinose transferase-like glycosyltransferase